MLPALKIETGPHGRNWPWPHRFRPVTNATGTNARAAVPFPHCRIDATRIARRNPRFARPARSGLRREFPQCRITLP